MESHFTMNLGVLSSVLCRWRSIEATVRGRPKPGQEAHLQNFRISENSWPQGTLTDKRPPKSLHAYTETKLHARASSGCPNPYQTHAAAVAKSLQSCLSLCDSIDGSPPGSPIPRILQARIQEWVAISFSRGSSQDRDQTLVSHTTGRLFSGWSKILKTEWSYR